MSTYILDTNDTIVMNDSIVVKISKTADACQTCVHEAATNWTDVEIVKYICIALVIIALIAACAVWLWKKAEIDAEEKERNARNTKEKEDNERKLKANCQEKLLVFLEKQIASNTTQTEEYRKACNAYIKELRALTNSKDIDKKADVENSSCTNSSDK